MCVCVCRVRCCLDCHCSPSILEHAPWTSGICIHLRKHTGISGQLRTLKCNLYLCDAFNGTCHISCIIFILQFRCCLVQWQSSPQSSRGFQNSHYVVLFCSAEPSPCVFCLASPRCGSKPEAVCNLLVSASPSMGSGH